MRKKGNVVIANKYTDLIDGGEAVLENGLYICTHILHLHSKELVATKRATAAAAPVEVLMASTR